MKLRSYIKSSLGLITAISLASCAPVEDPAAGTDPATNETTGGTGSTTSSTSTDSTTTTTGTDSESSATTSTGTGGSSVIPAVLGSLSIAFPKLALSSSFLQDTAATTLTLTSSEAEELTELPSPQEKVEILNSSFEAATVADCFKMKLRSFTQPACFAPNISRSAWESAQSDYSVTFPSTVNQLLYGDGGIVKSAESSGESCTAATINFFVEGAIGVIDQGKEIFAALVCASKFTEVDLPESSTSDFSSILSGVTLPNGFTFNKASMSHEEAADGSDIYTTNLQIDIADTEGNETIYAYFRHQPAAEEGGVDKGHAIVFHAGIPDPLNTANGVADGQPAGSPNQQPSGDPNQQPSGDPNQQPSGDPVNLALTETDPNQQQQDPNQQQQDPNQQQQDPNQQQQDPNQQQQDPNQQQPSGGASQSSNKIIGVSVSYQSDSTTTVARLYRADFGYDSGSNHPANFITSDGKIDHAAIAAIDAGNNLGQNIVDAHFVQSASGDVAGKGIVGWTASYNDSFWRTFTYNVARGDDDAETATSTFGFTPSYNQQAATVAAPSPALGMFCNWAQQGGANATSSANPHMVGSGLSGPATNSVQLQVSSRTAATDVFAHDATQSFMDYEVTPDCGGSSTNNLIEVQSDGSVTDRFTVPTIDALTPLGGVSLDASSIDLTTSFTGSRQ